MKTIYKLSILLLAAVSIVACRKGPDENPNPTTIDIKIEDGMVASPRWLADEIEKFAVNYKDYPAIKLYPLVYSFEYDGREYVYIHKIFSTGVNDAYFTSSGKLAFSGTDQAALDLYYALSVAMSKTGALAWWDEKWKEEPEPTAVDIKIENGRIVNPQWLVDIVDIAASTRPLTPAGHKSYPWVSSLEYDGRGYVYLEIPFSSSMGYYFTSPGKYIAPGSDLHDDLRWAERTLVWRDESWMDETSNSTRSDDSEGYSHIRNVYTPNGNLTWDTWIRDEFPAADIQLAKQVYLDYVRSRYPQAVILAEPTRTYNCHAYAWHIKGGYYDGIPVWMGKDNTSAAMAIYIQDGSYVEVTSNLSGAKVKYNSDSHSAIAESATTFVSKWGEGPLVRHPKDHGPYETWDLDYYKRANPIANFTISGPSNPSLNTNATYSFPAIPVGSGAYCYGWTITPSSYAVTGGTSGNSLNIKFTAATTYTLTAKFRITTREEDFSIHKTVTVSAASAPSITSVTWQSMNPPNPPTPGNYVTFTAAGDLAGATLEWTKGSGCDPYGGYAPNATSYMALVAQDSDAQISVSVRAKRNGVWSNTYYAYAPVNLPTPAPAAKDDEEGTEESETAELAR